MMIRNTALLLLLTASTSSAFMVVGPSSALSASRFGVVAPTATAAITAAATATASAPTMLFGAADSGEPVPDDNAIIDGEADLKVEAAGVGFGETAAAAEEVKVEEEVAAAAAADDDELIAADDEPVADVVVAEEEEPKEDPAAVALKEEISNAESDLKGKKATLSRILDDVDKYTESGFARRVAQMEDMKRIRMTMQSSNKETAVAGVVQNFLPVVDDLMVLKEEFGGTDFGAKYSGMAGTMMGALKELGVEEFTVEEGDVVNPQRVSVVEEEASDEVAKGSIIRPVSMGMELAGNVMRLAQVVASLGSAAEEEAAAIDVDVE